MSKRALSMMLCLVLCIGITPLPAFADGTGEQTVDVPTTQEISAQPDSKLQKPQGVKVAVTDMRQGTMESDYGNLSGTIATLAVQLGKVPGANQYFVCPLRRNAPGSNYAYDKVGSGTMPTVTANPGEKPRFETFDGEVEVGPNGEKITETDTTITIEKKVCILNKEPASDLEKHACYAKDETMVVEAQALYVKDTGSGYETKQSEAAYIEIPANENSKGRTFTEEGAETQAVTEVTLKTAKSAYTGKAQTPAVEFVKAGDTELKSSDYTVTYKNSKGKTIKTTAIKNVGTYQVVVSGKGNYSGSKTAVFKVTKAGNKATFAGKKTIRKTLEEKALKEKTRKLKLPKVWTKFGTAKWKVAKKDKKGVLSLKRGKVVVKKGAAKGTYTIRVKAVVSKTANFKGASTKTVTIKVKVY